MGGGGQLFLCTSCILETRPLMKLTHSVVKLSFFAMTISWASSMQYAFISST